MDAVVALSYCLLVAPTVTDAVWSGNWLAIALLATVAGALFLAVPTRWASLPLLQWLRWP